MALIVKSRRAASASKSSVNATVACRPSVPTSRRSVVISSEPERFVECVREVADLGFGEVYLHHVGQNQQPFLEAFGQQVLPALT